MAEIVSLVGTTHHPWYHKKTSAPEHELTDDARNLLAWSERVQDSFARTNPDAVVIVASDHFHQFFHNNMPQWIVGRMTSYQGTFYNEVREFDLPRVQLGGNRQLSTDIIEAGFEQGFDFAFSDEMRLDHACVVPSLISQPSLDIPVVPVLTNCGAPPIPKGQRFVALGPALRAAIEGSTAVERVAVVVSGNLSLEVGGPEQMMPYSVDPDFDVAAMDWLVNRDFDALVAESTYERLMTHGNTSMQFLNMITMAAMQDDMQVVHAEAMKRKGSPAPCFIYEKVEAAPVIDHYAVNKFLYDTDRNPEFVRRYIDDPEGYVDWYFAERMSRLLDNESEQSDVRTPDDATRTALATYDFATLYGEGAHPFILWTLMLPVIEAKLASGEFEAPLAPDGARLENRAPMAYYRERILPSGRPYFRY